MKLNEGKMKKIYMSAAALFFFFLAANITAQVASVTWPLTSDQNPNTPIGNIQALSQSIGTPTSPYKLEMYPQQPYASNGQQLWTGNQGTGWIAGLPDYTRYIQFDASPSSGNSFTVQFISFQYSDYPTPNNSDFHILKSEVWYSTDNWNSQGQVQLNSNPLDYLSSAIQTFSANVNVLVQNGQTFSLRIYPYAPNGAMAMTPSFATHRNVIIEGTTEASNTEESDCTDFENETTSGWQTNNALLTIVQEGENHYLQTTDQSGASSFFNESSPLIGDWNSYLTGGCGSLCWDVNYLYAGNGNDGSSQPITITPTIRIEGNGFAAYFLTNDIITAGDGWHSYCAPLKLIDNGDPLPSNSEGQWIMITGTNNDWNSMLSNITMLRFSIDPTSYQSERFGFDNICIKNTGDCNPPVQLGSICGMKFNDLNDNGRKDDGEPGLSGWTINLSLGAVQMTATTGADGSYCFNNLAAGTYTLSETPQDGWQQTTPASPGSHTVTLATDQSVANIDFGNKLLLGSICGMKFNDLNGNGINDGEPGLSGWIINLTGTVTMSDTTDADGNYCFNNLPVGTYTITEASKDGWQQTAPALPGSYTATLTPGLNLIGIDFGNKEIFEPDCTDFENNSLGGWQANNTSTSFQQNGENHFIQTTDQSGPSTFYNTSSAFTGNWSSLFSNGCGSLCFDFSFIYGGNIYNGVTPPQTFTPHIVIEGNGFSAAFITNNPVTVGDGWHSYCAPLSYLNSDGTLPSNSDGHWIMSVGTANDWNTLLNNVTKVKLPVDPTSYQNEKFGYDNICLKNTGDCNSPLTLGSICGIKIHDKDGDGIKDSNEDGIPNWTINLTDGTTIYTAVTDTNGNYCFNNLPAGTYIVSEESQQNWRQIFPPEPGYYTITLLPGQNITDINFSNVEDPTIELGSICGIKFNDINGDGDQDLPDELGLPNWQFNLTGTATLTTTTDLNGAFCFTNLRAGSYTIQEVIQDGWKPTAPDTTGTLNVTLSPGQNISEIYFGNQEILGSICGMKYNDLNGDGDWDVGEPRLPGWQITLSSMGYTASGHFSGPTLNLISTVTTDKNGTYCFTNVKPGNYIVGEIAQNGWTETEPSSYIYGITLTPGQEIEGLNFGNKEDVTIRLGSICGVKFNDKDGDGVQDDGELGIPDWQIQIGGPIDMTVVTDKNGRYCFENLIPGEYKVGEVMRTGWRQTLPSTNFYIIQLASGQFLDNINFGNKEDATVQLGSICGTKFNDKNGNGRQDDGELGISNWTVYLTGPINLTATTDDNGSFCFYGLTPGSYTVREENKVGWRQTKPSSVTYTLEVGNGDNFTGIDFGNKEDATIKLGSICGMKFNDLNGDGRKQDNEPGISNWTINLSGTMNLTTTTDSRGYYCFDNLRLGNYTVSEVNKDGWIPTAPSTGSYTVELTEDRNPDDLYFGNKEDVTVRLGSICGVKFNDKDGDGKQDDGELGIPDWQINLGGPVDRSVKTDKEGKYCFDDLTPGAYVIKEEMQSNWIQTYPASVSYTVVLTSGQNLMGYDFGNKYEPKVGCVQAPSGMVAWWSLDYSSRDARQDFAGFNNFGTMVNGPTQVAGKVLGALQFDGIDDYVEVADHSELNFGTGDFSFDAWLKTSDAQGVKIILDKRIEIQDLLTMYRGYSVFLSDGKLSLQIGDGLSIFNSYTNYSSPVIIADGNWHHIAITVSRNNTQGIIFYLDGVQIQFGNPTAYQGSINNDTPLHIGSISFSGIFSGIEKFKGILDEVELFNRVLTQAEIASIFNAGSSGKCKPNNPGGSVSGGVWHDVNHNGVKDPTEVGLTQWTVLLNGPTIAQTETDENGNFVFTDMKPGNYTLSVAAQNNWGCIFPLGGRYPFMLEEGQTLDALNFGFADDPCSSGQKTWLPLGSGVSATVLAFAVIGNDLYVGGTFSVAGGVNVKSIAKWNGSSWSDVGGGVNGIVTSLAVIGNDLYVGGFFNTAGNISAKNIAKWDGLNWSSLGDGTNSVVHSLAANSTTLFAGGEFTTAGNINAAHVAKWNGYSWSALGSGMNDIVYALTASGNDLYAGGKFTIAGNVNAARVAKWNGLSLSWSTLGNGLNNHVSSLVVMNGEIYAAGIFTNSGGSSLLNKVAKWDGTNWVPLGNGIAGNGSIGSLVTDGMELFIGGFFNTTGTIQVNSIAKWDGNNWSALGNGVSGYNQNVVMAMTTIGSDLYVGGAFTIAGRVGANNIAKYSCSIPTSVDDDRHGNVLPQSFQLEQNYPNPFNPTTTIRYNIPKAGFVKISVYNILGQEIKVLVNEERNPGVYEVKFSAKGGSAFDGTNLASGIYFYTIRTGNFMQSKKMILIK